MKQERSATQIIPLGDLLSKKQEELRTVPDDELVTAYEFLIQEGRGEEVMYHVGRPGHDFIMERTLQAWGIDGHNSHTNICSASARLGYVLWHHADRPSPDHANAASFCFYPLTLSRDTISILTRSASLTAKWLAPS
jgi:hypothetical protein